MSTRCRIAIKNEQGNYESVYCHHDGYPSGVGKTLKKSYTDIAKIRELFQLGDMSVLGDTIESCDFYARDRGEGMNDPQINSSAIELFEMFRKSDQEYLYIFDNGEWNGYSSSLDPLIGEDWND